MLPKEHARDILTSNSQLLSHSPVDQRGIRTTISQDKDGQVSLILNSSPHLCLSRGKSQGLHCSRAPENPTLRLCHLDPLHETPAAQTSRGLTDISKHGLPQEPQHAGLGVSCRTFVDGRKNVCTRRTHGENTRRRIHERGAHRTFMEGGCEVRMLTEARTRYYGFTSY